MTLRDTITLIQNSELKQLAMKNDVDVIVSFINLGLIELYKRFALKTKEYIIEAVANVDKYEMPADYMWLLEAYHYKVTRTDYMKATPSDIEVLPINDDTIDHSVNSIGYNMVQIGNLEVGHLYSLVYVTSPIKMDSSNLDINVPLPEQFIEALMHYVGYLANSTISSPNHSQDNTFYTRFEASVQRLLLNGAFTQEGLCSSNRLYMKGFV